MAKKTEKMRLIYLKAIDGNLYAYRRWHGKGSKRMSVSENDGRLFHIFIDPSPIKMLKGTGMPFYTL